MDIDEEDGEFPIQKKVKPDPVLDSELEVKKWVEQRKKHYPSENKINKDKRREKEREGLG